MKYNIYCDESCHLEHDNSDVMIIGGLVCKRDHADTINKSIFQIKEKYHVYKYAEIKWTKVSPSKLDMYKELVDLFFDDEELSFRAVVATNKHLLNYAKYHLTHDDWYHRIYYLTLRELIEIGDVHYVYADIKDTRSSKKIETLKNVLNNVTDYFYNETVQNIQLVRSDQIQLLQLTDLLIGAVSYANRHLSGSTARLELIKYIENKCNHSLTETTRRGEDKFNIFVWTPREVR